MHSLEYVGKITTLSHYYENDIMIETDIYVAHIKAASEAQP